MTVQILDEPLPDSETSEPRPRVQSVARASAILVSIGNNSDGMHPREISRELGLSRPTTYHLLHTLAQTGLVSRTTEGRYVLGLRIGTLSEAYRRQLAEGAQLSALLREIARKTGESTSATKWTNGEALVVDSVHGAHQIQAIQVPHGYSDAAYARAAGKLLLATTTEQQRQEYFANHKLDKRTPHTATSISDLTRQFDVIRKVEYSLEREEFAIGVSCLAISIGGQASPYAVTISAPAERFEREWEGYLSILRQAVAGCFGS